jgi:hypothetical protein
VKKSIENLYKKLLNSNKFTWMWALGGTKRIDKVIDNLPENR